MKRMLKTEQEEIHSCQTFRKVIKVQTPSKACQSLTIQKPRHYIN